MFLGPLTAGAQIVRDSTSMSIVGGASVPATVDAAMLAQSAFESFRFDSLPLEHEHGSCIQIPRNECYWWEAEPRTPVEPAATRDRREQLLQLLDSVAVNAPGDRWGVEQRVRYLDEAGRPDSALSAARACRVSTWACDVLVGFALHELGRYLASDSAYGRALARMSPKDRCDWRNVDLLIDDDLSHQLAQFPCGNPRRDTLEDRMWYYARTLYSIDGNDSRTEHYARKTMQMILRDAPDVASDSVLRPTFPPGERVFESYLRWGWPRGWAKSRSALPALAFVLSAGLRGGLKGSWALFPSMPRPGYRYVPPASVLDDPSTSDSSGWFLKQTSAPNARPGLRVTENGKEIWRIDPVRPPIPIARYAPPYAKSLTPLEHQKAMFRRGDSALVVMAYDSRAAKPLAGGVLTAALVVTPNVTPPVGYAKIAHAAPATGVLIATAPWGPLLMSAEVYALDKQAVARARYGISPPVAVGTRVTLSDLLLYKPYGTFPASVEDAAPHALTTERLMANEKLGVYWESYGTDPGGEKIKVSLTVLREAPEAGIAERLTELLKPAREATPVVVSVEDLSALGKSVTPRALEVDISTLKKGTYIVQLEEEVTGQYVIRAEHRIEVIGP